MRQRKGLLRAEILSYSVTRDRTCVLDFSTIPSSVYADFFAGLPTFLYSKLHRVAFNCALSVKSKVRRKLPRHEEERLADSIYSHHSNFDAYLIKTLERVLPRCKSLQCLSLSDIRVSSNRFQPFVRACVNARFLRSLELRYITIRAPNAAFLLQVISPFKFRTFVLASCALASELSGSVRKLLTRESRHGEGWALEVLDLSGNFFTESELGDFDAELRRRQGAVTAGADAGDEEIDVDVDPRARRPVPALGRPPVGSELSGSSATRRRRTAPDPELKLLSESPSSSAGPPPPADEAPPPADEAPPPADEAPPPADEAPPPEVATANEEEDLTLNSDVPDEGPIRSPNAPTGDSHEGSNNDGYEEDGIETQPAANDAADAEIADEEEAEEDAEEDVGEDADTAGDQGIEQPLEEGGEEDDEEDLIEDDPLEIRPMSDVQLDDAEEADIMGDEEEQIEEEDASDNDVQGDD
jgi:hypothetical protein